MKIIIGSTAIKHWFPDFLSEPKDLDYAVDIASNYQRSPGIEYLENPVILKYVDPNETYLNPSLLLTLKMSHMCWDFNWDKHMFHIQFLLDKGLTWNQDIFYELHEYWKTVLPKIRRSELNMSKEDFFTNSVNYDENEHDFLHTLLRSIPTYTTILEDGKEVEISERKFLSLTYEQKLDIVYEEVMVMAYERYKQFHFRKAHLRMLNKFIKQHAPLWMVPFAIQNYKTLIKPQFNFIQTIENGLSKTKQNA